MSALDPLNAEKAEYLEKKILPYFQNHRMGYIKVPTGWGKTFLSKHLMAKYYGDRKNVLFLVSGNNALLKQTCFVDDNETVPLFPNYALLAADSGQTGRTAAERLWAGNIDGSVVFASLQTLNHKNNSVLKEMALSAIDLLIVDEIHNFIDNKGNSFITDFRNRGHAHIFGMTATPFQGIVGNVKFVADISDKYEMEQIFDKSLIRCILEDQLSAIDYGIFKSEMDFSDIFAMGENLEGLKKDELQLCYSPEKLQSIIERTTLAKKIYKEIIVKTGNEKTLIFCAPVKGAVKGSGEDEEKITAFHAKLCAAIFNEEIENIADPQAKFDNFQPDRTPKLAAYLSSGIPDADKKSIVKAFKTPGKLPFVLCTVGMLIEGFDFPELENLILLRPTLSMRLFEQQVGRIARKAENKKFGRVFEVVDKTESLYDRFGECVFSIDQSKLAFLRPEIRIEEMLTEDDPERVGDYAEIRKAFNICEMSIDEQEHLVSSTNISIPAVSHRMDHMRRLLSVVRKATEGSMMDYCNQLMAAARGIRIATFEDIQKIKELILEIEQMEYESHDGDTLSKQCARKKPEILKELKWFIRLVTLTRIKDLRLTSEDQIRMMKAISWRDSLLPIDDARLTCLEEGTRLASGGLAKGILNFVKQVEGLRKWGFLKKNSKLSFTHWYWADFLRDFEEIRKVVEAPETRKAMPRIRNKFHLIG